MKARGLTAVVGAVLVVAAGGGAGEPDPKKADLFAPGTVWQGKIRAGVPADSNGRKMTITIDEKKGTVVKGSIAVYSNDGKNTFGDLPFTGEVPADGSTFRFTTSKVGFQQLKGSGKVNGGVAALNVHGAIGGQGDIKVDHKVSLAPRQ